MPHRSVDERGIGRGRPIGAADRGRPTPFRGRFVRVPESSRRPDAAASVGCLAVGIAWICRIPCRQSTGIGAPSPAAVRALHRRAWLVRRRARRRPAVSAAAPALLWPALAGAPRSGRRWAQAKPRFGWRLRAGRARDAPPIRLVLRCRRRRLRRVPRTQIRFLLHWAVSG